jgi:uncharacterized protein
MLPPLAKPLVQHRAAIADLCRAHGVEKLEVFGSAANGRFDAARSDIDLIASFSPAVESSIAQHFFALEQALESLLGYRVDLLTDQPIRNPYLRATVDASRRELYVRAPAEIS